MIKHNGRTHYRCAISKSLMAIRGLLSHFRPQTSQPHARIDELTDNNGKTHLDKFLSNATEIIAGLVEDNLGHCAARARISQNILTICIKAVWIFKNIKWNYRKNPFYNLNPKASLKLNKQNYSWSTSYADKNFW